MASPERKPVAAVAGPDGTGPTADRWRGPWPPGWTVGHVAETASTNADLVAGAAQHPDRTVLVADHQTAGRGRLDRRWDAPPGENLLVSMLFREVPDDAGDLVRRVSLAALDAIAEVAPRAGTPRIKWPNDVLLDGSKVAGVLAARVAGGPVVVGIGINVGWCPDGAARVGGAGAVSRPGLLAALLAAYDRLAAAAPADVLARYRAELATLGQRVRVERPAGDDLVGRAVTVTADGRLVIADDDGASHTVDVGDIVHLRSLG